MNDKIFNYKIEDEFLWSEVSLKGERKFYIEGYASTIDRDKAGEVVDYSAQEDIFAQIKSENITLDLEHELWYGPKGELLPKPANNRIPVAKIVDAKLTPRGVWIKAELNQHISRFSELWGSIKDGFLKAFSVAFYPVEKVGSIIKRLNIVNVTLTGSPVNSNATFAVSMKSAVAWLDTIKQVEESKMENKPEVKSEPVPEVKSEPVQAAPEVKSEPVQAAPEVKSEPVQTFDVQAALKAMKESHEAEINSLHSEIASLKAELAKPVMKATVEAAMPEVKPITRIVSPLGLVG